MGDDTKTEFCSNCKRDIPSANYVMHVNHCKRNITLCKQCQEPVPTSQMEEHFEENHVEVRCECGESVEKMDLEDHKENSCPSRSVSCEYCELSLPFSEMDQHKEYCGSRTELCEKCKKYIKFRDQEEHEKIKCDLIKPEAPKNNVTHNPSSNPRGTLRAAGLSGQRDEVPHVDFPMSHELMKILRRGHGTLPTPSPYGLEEPFHAGLISRGGNPARLDKNERRRHLKPNNRRPSEQDGDQPSAAMTPLPNNGDVVRTKTRVQNPRENEYKPNAHERLQPREDDDVMASYLQDQEDAMWNSPFTNPFPQAMQPDFGGTFADSLDETNLPCEFCDHMFPASELILHQDEENENYYKECEEDEVVGVKGNLDEEPFLPCEFCEVQLPAHALFHHQATCDVRPPSVVPSSNLRDTESLQHNARPRAKQSRPTRPVHAQLLDPNSSDDDRYAEDPFSRTSKVQQYRENDTARNGADYTEACRGFSSIQRGIEEKPRASLEKNALNSSPRKNRSRNNDPSGRGYRASEAAERSLPPLSRVPPFQRTASNDLSAPATFTGAYLERKKRNDRSSRDDSRARPGDGVKSESEFAAPLREFPVKAKKMSTAAGQRPRAAENARGYEDISRQPKRATTRETGTEAPLAASGTPEGSTLPAKKKINDWSRARAPGKSTSGAAASTGASCNAGSGNPRRSGVKKFDLDALARQGRGVNTSDTSSSRRDQSTRNRTQRKKIA